TFSSFVVPMFHAPPLLGRWTGPFRLKGGVTTLEVISIREALARRASRQAHPDYIRRLLALARMREWELTSQGRCAHCERSAGRDAVSVTGGGLFGDRRYCRSGWNGPAE